PERLQRAKGPAEALADQLAGGDGRFGPGDGALFVADTPAEATNGDGEVGVFGDGFGGDAAGSRDGFLSPRTKRAGHDRYAVQQVERALFQFLVGDVLGGLPATCHAS